MTKQNFNEEDYGLFGKLAKREFSLREDLDRTKCDLVNILNTASNINRKKFGEFARKAGNSIFPSWKSGNYGNYRIGLGDFLNVEITPERAGAALGAASYLGIYSAINYMVGNSMADIFERTALTLPLHFIGMSVFGSQGQYLGEKLKDKISFKKPYGNILESLSKDSKVEGKVRLIGEQ